MGTRSGFADVLLSMLAGEPPPVAPGRQTERRIASPGWVHRLEPLRVARAHAFHQRYPQSVSAAPAAAGIPVGAAPEPPRGGPRWRTPRERVAIQLLNRLGANLTDAATDEDIRSAYRQLVRETHPDRHQDADSAALEAHARRLRAVIRAWGVFQGHAAA